MGVVIVTTFGRFKSWLLIDGSVQMLVIGLFLVVLVVIGCCVGGLGLVGALFGRNVFVMAHRMVNGLQIRRRLGIIVRSFACGSSLGQFRCKSLGKGDLAVDEANMEGGAIGGV